MQEEEETLQTELTGLLGQAEAARIMSAKHRPLTGLVDLSLLIRQASTHLACLPHASAAVGQLNLPNRNGRFGVYIFYGAENLPLGN